jgi:NADPH2:quinone reductase
MKSRTWQFDAYGTPGDVLVWQEQALPEPGPGQALVKISAIGINRSDLNYVEGQYFPARHFPSCLGSEAVGEVIALGPPGQVKRQPLKRLRLTVGMRVGTLTERIDQAGMGVYRDVGLYDQSALVPVPGVFSDAEGAAFWVAVLTMGGAMEMAGLNASTAAGKTVLITAAASGMGVIALKLAKLWGATTIATTRHAEKVRNLDPLADHVLICEDSAGLADGVKGATDGRGVDVALDPVGAVFYPGLLEAMAHGGQIVSYECITGSQAAISIMDMMLKDVSVHGFTVFRPFGNPVLLNSLVDLGMDNAQALKPVISDTFDLANAPQALEVLRHSGHVGKIVLTLPAV